MDVIDIAADVIRERDRLKERVRELEWEYWIKLDLIHMQSQRIAKAKAILIDSTRPLEERVWDRVNEALEALEGK